MRVPTKFKKFLCGCLIGLPALAPALAQPAWPSQKPITLVVPWSPGGVADFLGRQMAEMLTKHLKQTVVVENKPGAGTNIGSTDVARASPDGYTLLLSSSTNAVNMSLYKNLRYDTSKDFAPVILVGYTPMVLVGNPSLEPASLPELLSYSKAHPGNIAYASAGAGSPAHLAGEMFKHQAKVDWLHIPYKGAGPAVTDLMGGQVQVMFTNVPASLGGIQSGKLRAFAITGSERSSALPNIPTFAEAGMPEFAPTGWYGVFAPAGTPASVVQKLAETIKEGLNSGGYSERVKGQGVDLALIGPNEFKEIIANDIVFYKGLIEKAGIQINQ